MKIHLDSRLPGSGFACYLIAQGYEVAHHFGGVWVDGSPIQCDLHALAVYTQLLWDYENKGAVTLAARFLQKRSAASVQQIIGTLASTLDVRALTYNESIFDIVDPCETYFIFKDGSIIIAFKGTIRLQN